MNQLKIIALENIKEVGEKVNLKLREIRGEDKNYILNITASRFSNGEGKVKIEDTVRENDVYLLADVGNYGITYPMYGFTHHMGPDEHFQDIKRVISALSGYAKDVTVIMPLLYQSRQHKRKVGESVDCALALQELERLGVGHIVTFDVHDPTISNSVPNLPFDNFYPTNTILEDLLQTEKLNDVLVISPDKGAMDRARNFSELLDTNIGVFHKKRDLTKVVHGKNPIIEHTYMGPNVLGKDVLVIDDMIASGDSMLEVAEKLKKDGANKVYFIATFSLFTEGVQKFDSAYQNQYFDKLYTTNLSYVPEEYREKEWFHTVDCSEDIAEVINALHNREPLKSIDDGKRKILTLRKEKGL